MKKPDLHPREAERLKALENLKIMDTFPEREFDDITLIASQICATPIALVSLIDNSRQWFKSKVGLNASETPKDFAFCAHAILQNEVFVIGDSSKDVRFFDNPLATGAPYVQFYAGAPLLDPTTNLPIGTLCVIDNKPRKLNDDQIDALKALSNQVYKLLELRTNISSLVSTNKRLIFQKTAFDNMSEGVVLQDRSGKIIDYNSSALRVLDMSSEQLIGKTSMDPDWQSIREDGSFYPGNEHPAMRAIATALPQKNVIMGIQTKNNETRWISISSIPLFLEDEAKPSHSVTTFADITIQRAVQQALFQSAKMTSLGEMAGGVAHEINTPLAVIIAISNQIVTYLENKALDLEKISYKIKKIESTAQRIAQIVRGLRTFSRNAEGDPWQDVSIRQLILDATSLCAEKFKNNSIKLDINLAIDATVTGIPTQISQVILNLLNNAYDAISENQEKWVRVDLEKAENKVKLRVTDSGLGIATEVQSKMMQPFFTTKEVGKGTGLGLSISKGIIESFKGRLYYEINNKNTSFVIELTIANEKQDSEFI